MKIRRAKRPWGRGVHKKGHDDVVSFFVEKLNAFEESAFRSALKPKPEPSAAGNGYPTATQQSGRRWGRRSNEAERMPAGRRAEQSEGCDDERGCHDDPEH